MKKAALRISVAAITFIIGIAAAWLWILRTDSRVNDVAKQRSSALLMSINLSLPCAARDTDMSVKMLIASGAFDVDGSADECINVEPSPRGVTLLMQASGRGNKEDVKLLLNSGANAKLRNSYGDDALMYATGKGDIEIMTMLIERGADVNTLGDAGHTPLVRAAGDGNVETVKFLLNNGANLDVQDSNGSTALMFAAGYKQTQVVKLLLNEGANSKLKDKRGRTFATYAKSGYPEEYIIYLR